MNRDTWEKWIDSNWFLRCVSLLLAVMLFISATWEGKVEKQTLFGSKSETQTVTNIQLELYYDQENLIVTGAPANVTVDLTGPNNITKSTSVQRQFSIFADLRELPLGTHTVDLNYDNISEKLSVAIIPENITVNIQEKVTKEFDIEIDYINRNQIKEGFTVGAIKINPSRVKITGAKDKIEEIALVKAIVDLNGVEKSFDTRSKVVVYDAQGNPLDVILEEESVVAEVEILNPNKEIPIKLIVDKPLKDEYALVSLTPEFEKVTLFGLNQEALDELPASLEIPLDLRKVEKTQEIEVKIPVPDGMVSSYPEMMKVLVTVEKKTERTLKNISIRVDDLKTGQKIEFIRPKDGTVDVKVFGAPSLINDLTADDIPVYFSVIGKNTGTYQSNLKVKSLQNIEFTLIDKQVEYELK